MCLPCWPTCGVTCVCAVFRRHLLEAAEQVSVPCLGSRRVGWVLADQVAHNGSLVVIQNLEDVDVFMCHRSSVFFLVQHDIIYTKSA